jgi:hypothetical protein
MTSFKKPLIAIATAVVLATTTFVGVANATGTTFTLTGGNYNDVSGATSAEAISLPVPADNKVDAADVLDIALSNIVAGTTVTAVATNATLVTAVNAVDAPVTASTGSSTLSIATGTGTTADLKVYTKTTKVGKVVITVGTNTPVTYYVKGLAGSLSSVSVSAPTAALGTIAKVTVTGSDVFGNGVSGAGVSLQVIGSTATNAYSLTTTTDGTVVKSISDLVVDTYDLIVTATVADAVDGLAKPVGFVKGQLKIVDLSAIVAAKDAELATKIADLTAANTALATANATIADIKAQYNALVKKYNKHVTKKFRKKLMK